MDEPNVYHIAGSLPNFSPTAQDGQMTLLCPKDGTFLGRYVNRWEKVSNSYFRPLTPERSRKDLGLNASKQIVGAAEHSQLAGCKIQELSCKKCNLSLGVKCIGAPDIKHHYKGCRFLKLYKIECKGTKGGQPVEPIIEQDSFANLAPKGRGSSNLDNLGNTSHAQPSLFQRPGVPIRNEDVVEVERQSSGQLQDKTTPTEPPSSNSSVVSAIIDTQNKKITRISDAMDRLQAEMNIVQNSLRDLQNEVLEQKVQHDHNRGDSGIEKRLDLLTGVVNRLAKNINDIAPIKRRVNTLETSHLALLSTPDREFPPIQQPHRTRTFGEQQIADRLFGTPVGSEPSTILRPRANSFARSHQSTVKPSSNFLDLSSSFSNSQTEHQSLYPPRILPQTSNDAILQRSRQLYDSSSFQVQEGSTQATPLQISDSSVFRLSHINQGSHENHENFARDQMTNKENRHDQLSRSGLDASSARDRHQLIRNSHAGCFLDYLNGESNSRNGAMVTESHQLVPVTTNTLRSNSSHNGDIPTSVAETVIENESACPSIERKNLSAPPVSDDQRIENSSADKLIPTIERSPQHKPSMIASIANQKSLTLQSLTNLYSELNGNGKRENPTFSSTPEVDIPAQQGLDQYYDLKGSHPELSEHTDDPRGSGSYISSEGEHRHQPTRENVSPKDNGRNHSRSKRIRLHGPTDASNGTPQNGSNENETHTSDMDKSLQKEESLGETTAPIPTQRIPIRDSEAQPSGRGRRSTLSSTDRPSISIPARRKSGRSASMGPTPHRNIATGAAPSKKPSTSRRGKAKSLHKAVTEQGSPSSTRPDEQLLADLANIATLLPQGKNTLGDDSATKEGKSSLNGQARSNQTPRRVGRPPKKRLRQSYG
ncbi:MAG: hypothetical protein M1834_005182 [Cirrosporium novae-zelandiae]|nr:MAG: hypothetical protein M1834_005182 [Cirrosporium novae-zelandiae]